MQYVIIDLESDGLLKEVTKIHCLAYTIIEDSKVIEKGFITEGHKIKNFLEEQKILVGHSIIRFDIPVLQKLLDYDPKETQLIDTLGLSWYLYPIKGFRHGLEFWGDRLEIAKPVIDDWEQLELSAYIERCKADVNINVALFQHQLEYLNKIYENQEDLDRIIVYISFKLDCLREQEFHGIILDKRLAAKSRLNLEFIIEEKISALRDKMPLELGIIRKNKPKVMYRKDGSMSSHGEKWFEELNRVNLPTETTVLRDLPNPTSHKQMKLWLFELGWKPQTFKETTAKDKKGQMVPQISLPQGAGLCPSIKNMFELHPYLEPLGGLYKARHRESIFSAYLEDVDDKGKIYSSAQGFTNTLRFQHKRPIVNLPQPHRFYGKEVRGCLTVPDDEHIMVGADLSGLEDNTKQHFIYFYDPEYVKEMQVPDFDSHLDIGILSKLLTEKEVKFYKEFEKKYPTKEKREKYAIKEDKEEYSKIKKIRSKAKTVNFSAVYGVGAAKMSLTLNYSFQDAKALLRTYWKRNKAVKQVAAACKVKVVQGHKWLFNPVSNFWLYLKTDKDRFSTLNQNTGVYVFDAWISNARKRLGPMNIPILLQYHDELMLICKKGDLNLVIAHLKQAMNEVNNELQLNVMIHNSVEVGNDYSECH